MMDEIIAMAREVGLLAEGEGWVRPHKEAMERFYQLVVTKEREKQAKESKLYAELIYAVASHFPDETCHETALRYIKQAERGSAVAAYPEGEK